MDCHVAPDAKDAAYLRNHPETLCVGCHDDLGWKADEGELAHPPEKRDCTQCHSPHQSRVRNLMRDEATLRQCSECHVDFLLEAAKKPYSHKHFELVIECGFCHHAHRRGNTGKFLRANTSNSCLTCHDIPILFHGRVLQSVARDIRTAPVVHKAIEGDSCPACHTPHGSDQPAQLRAGYPAGSYEEYKPENYALCLQCHSKSLIEDPSGKGVTGFANSKENLHRRHLTGIKAGRACLLCHSAHTSVRPHLLRERLVFQKWNAPFNYVPLSEGGQCDTPCHGSKSYAREFPVPGIPRPVTRTSAFDPPTKPPILP